jgi:hypothetical protein
MDVWDRGPKTDDGLLEAGRSVLADVVGRDELTE